MIRDGILNINKPAGMTSHDVVNIVRRAAGIRRVGHTGTLDPMAEGVLPVCIGSAARVSEYLDLDFKTYRCRLRFGQVTDTLDIWGKLLEERETGSLTESVIREALSSFKGLIKQVPPMYSAVKVGGRKLYEYAREGVHIQVKPREVFIRELTVEEVDLDAAEAVFSVECTKGTYIRSICGEAGELLGTGAVMSAMTRTASGAFSLAGAIELEKIREAGAEELAALMLPVDFPLTHFGKAVTDSENGRRFADGFHLPPGCCRIEREPEFAGRDFVLPLRAEYRRAYNVYMEEAGEEIFLGVAFYNDKYKKLVADKVFYKR